MLAEPKCFARGCMHYKGVKSPNSDDEVGQYHHCPAFPDGIPSEIAYGRDQHWQVHPKQKGDLIFTPNGKGREFCPVCNEELVGMDAGLFCVNTECPVRDDAAIYEELRGAVIVARKDNEFLVQTSKMGVVPFGYWVDLDNEVVVQQNLFSLYRSGDWDQNAKVSEETKRKIIDTIRREKLG